MKGLQSRPRKITLLLKTNPSPRDQAKKRRRARERANVQTVMGGRNVPGPVPVPGVKGTSVPVEAPAPTVADELIAMATMDALSAVVAPLGRPPDLDLDLEVPPKKSQTILLRISGRYSYPSW